MVIKEKIMRKMIVLVMVAFGFVAPAQAGFGPFIEDLVVEDLGGGLTHVRGSLVGIRFTADETQQLGCSFAAGAGGVPRVACLGRDLNENNHFCFSFDPALIEVAKSISPYSFVSFVYDQTGQCTSISLSVRSHHIPDSTTEKSKIK